MNLLHLICSPLSSRFPSIGMQASNNAHAGYSIVRPWTIFSSVETNSIRFFSTPKIASIERGLLGIFKPPHCLISRDKMKLAHTSATVASVKSTKMRTSLRKPGVAEA
jgi:hypothetical protein